MSKKIIITGATGSIGKILCEELAKRGNEITVFTRNPAQAKTLIEGVKEFVKWNYEIPEDWKSYLNGKDIVIHLAGMSIAGKRWNSTYKNLISESRIISTRNLTKAIEEAKHKPSIFISASAVGYYGNAGDNLLVEESENGSDFLSQVCKNWEAEAEKVARLDIRSLSISTGIVLDKGSGALKKILLPYKFFVGGPLGSGNQWFPWIHIDDLIRIYLYAIENNSVNGIINAAAPNPVLMKNFANTLGKILHRPSLFRIPLFALKIAIGKAAESVVASQRVVPKKLMESGFKFKFENVEDALRDLLK